MTSTVLFHDRQRNVIAAFASFAAILLLALYVGLTAAEPANANVSYVQTDTTSIEITSTRWNKRMPVRYIVTWKTSQGRVISRDVASTRTGRFALAAPAGATRVTINIRPLRGTQTPFVFTRGLRRGHTAVATVTFTGRAALPLGIFPY